MIFWLSLTLLAQLSKFMHFQTIFQSFHFLILCLSNLYLLNSLVGMPTASLRESWRTLTPLPLQNGATLISLSSTCLWEWRVRKTAARLTALVFTKTISSNQKILLLWTPYFTKVGDVWAASKVRGFLRALSFILFQRSRWLASRKRFNFQNSGSFGTENFILNENVRLWFLQSV